MQSNQSFKAYCSDIQCGYESLSSAGSVPIRSRQHRRMTYVGSKRIGIASLVLYSVLDPGNPVELGTYHVYACPVCGQESMFLEKWGMTRRVG